ncbi:SKP1-like protein 1 [Zea mays]|uniref:SKP1-like protein 1 n=1 Tax=Zea mays TaxID=4577 RepID=UPI0004DEC8CB|nr:SKP1-like protein 1 [Zea mays]
MGEKKMLTLRSSDCEEFEVEEAVLMKSEIIRFMIEDDCSDNVIPLPNVNSKTLALVIEYCNKHVHDAAKPADAAETTNASSAGGGGEVDLKKWDAEFGKVAPATLFDRVELPFFIRVELPFFDPIRATRMPKMKESEKRKTRFDKGITLNKSVDPPMND